MPLKLDVRGLAWKTDDKRLAEVFGAFGQLRAAKVATDWETGRSRRFGSVTFAEEDHADAAMAALQGAEVDGSPIVIEVAPGQMRTPKPAAAAPAAAADEAPVDAGVKAAAAAKRKSSAPAARGGPGGVAGRSGGKDESQTFG